LLSCFTERSTEAEAAFSELYQRYSGKIHAYCVKMLNDEDAAEDIFQDTFIRFYQNIDLKRNNVNVSSFLFTIARNLCYNFIRDKKQILSIENMDFSDDFKNPAEEKELLEMITMALDLISVKYKEAFILREYNDLSYEEIALLLELSVSNAKARVRRAKNKIREILEPYLNEAIS